MPQFILKIDLGKHPMIDPKARIEADKKIVSALRNAAKDIDCVFDLFDPIGMPIPPNHYPVCDINGNVVGHYEVRD